MQFLFSCSETECVRLLYWVSVSGEAPVAADWPARCRILWCSSLLNKWRPANGLTYSTERNISILLISHCLHRRESQPDEGPLGAKWSVTWTRSCFRGIVGLGSRWAGLSALWMWDLLLLPGCQIGCTSKTWDPLRMLLILFVRAVFGHVYEAS